MNEKEFNLKKAAGMLSAYFGTDISESDVSVILKILEMTKKKTDVVPAPPNCDVGKDFLEYIRDNSVADVLNGKTFTNATDKEPNNIDLHTIADGLINKSWSYHLWLPIVKRRGKEAWDKFTDIYTQIYYLPLLDGVDPNQVYSDRIIEPKNLEGIEVYEKMKGE